MTGKQYIVNCSPNWLVENLLDHVENHVVGEKLHYRPRLVNNGRSLTEEQPITDIKGVVHLILRLC